MAEERTTDILTARVLTAIRLQFPHYPITEAVACEAVRATLSEILPEIVCGADHMMISRKKRETRSGV